MTGEGAIVHCIWVCFAGREPLPDVRSRTAEAKRMLDSWRSSYMDVRKKIEDSGRDARWEFNRSKLFDQTDFMASICQDLYNIAQVCVCMNFWTFLFCFLLLYSHSTRLFSIIFLN